MERPRGASLAGRAVHLMVALMAASQVSCTDAPAAGSLVVLMEAPARTLDPRFATADVDVKVSRLLFAGLVSSDTPDGQPVFDLAESVLEQPPGTWTIRLRGDARFHDGAPVTSADVVYTFGALDEPNVRSPFAGSWRDVEIEPLDDLTVRFTLPEPSATFLVDIDRGIVPRHLLLETGRFDGDPIGAGPWRFVGRERDGTVTIGRSEEEAGRGPVQLVFRPVPDDNSRLIAMLAGAADLTLNTVAPLMLPVVERDPNLRVERSPSFKYTYLAFNMDHPILSDVRVRQAIAHAIDREEIIEYKFRGTARLSSNMLPPEHWAAAPDVRRWGHDPDRARALLDEAGLIPDARSGCRTELVFKTSSNRFRRSVAAVIAAQLTEVGICTRVQSYEWGTFFEDIRSGNFEMTTLQWPSVLDPDILRWVFHSENIPDAERRGGGNRGRFRNAEVDRLLDEARTTSERDERRRRYYRVQEILAEELPYVSLWHEDNIVVRRSHVRGFTPTPNARFPGLGAVEIEGDRERPQEEP